MRALQRLPRRAMVATNGVGVGVVVAVAVLVAGESGRHQTEHAAGARGSLRRSVQFAFRRRTAKYTTAGAVGSVATHVIPYIIAYSCTKRRRRSVNHFAELDHAGDARIVRAIILTSNRTVTFHQRNYMIDGRITERAPVANVENSGSTFWERR